MRSPARNIPRSCSSLIVSLSISRKISALYGTDPQFASMLTEYLPAPSGLRLPVYSGYAK